MFKMVTIWRTPSLLLLIAGSLTQKSSGFMPYSFVHNTARKQSTLMQMSTKDAVEQNRAVVSKLLLNLTIAASVASLFVFIYSVLPRDWV